MKRQNNYSVPLDHCPASLRGNSLDIAVIGGEPKKAQAQEAIKTFRALGIPLSGAKILDVGCGQGYHTKALREAGADAYAVEPNRDTLEQAVAEGNVESVKALPIKLQELPGKYARTFDAAAVFCYCIPKVECDSFFKALAESIKPGGRVLIGIADGEEEQYVDSPYASILPSVEKYFGMTEKHPTNGINRVVLSLSSPRCYSKTLAPERKPWTPGDVTKNGLSQGMPWSFGL